MSNQCISEDCANHEKISHYYCDVCKFHSNDPTRDIFHCDECGFCRVGKKEEVVHCKTCNACFGSAHKCKGNLNQDCPICTEDLFTSTFQSTFMKCGHPCHLKCLDGNPSFYKYFQLKTICFKGWLKRGNYTCPLCKRSCVNMQNEWILMDQHIQIQPMPEIFSKTTSEIICNDCQKTSVCKFHFVGHRCSGCGSYNTDVPLFFIPYQILKPIFL